MTYAFGIAGNSKHSPELLIPVLNQINLNKQTGFIDEIGIYFLICQIENLVDMSEDFKISPKRSCDLTYEVDNIIVKLRIF